MNKNLAGWYRISETRLKVNNSVETNKSKEIKLSQPNVPQFMFLFTTIQFPLQLLQPGVGQTNSRWTNPETQQGNNVGDIPSLHCIALW